MVQKNVCSECEGQADACPNCGGGEFHKEFQSYGAVEVFCAKCGFVF